MSATVQYRFSSARLDTDALAALLGELPFDAFETEDGKEDALSAYLPLESDTHELHMSLVELADEFGLRYTREEIADENWNQLWEDSFAPAEIGDFLRIRAPFHSPDERFAEELEIVPEMSFGTGHHETTYLMASLLHEFSPFGKTVFDFGTGTGVLALYAALLGAGLVTATDNDPRCVTSTLANADRNDVDLHYVGLGDETSLPEGPFDLILANIQRGVLIAAMPALAERLARRGELWLSGILVDDLDAIDAAAASARLGRIDLRRRGSWLACRYASNS